jgi:hypothetical protein
MAERKKRKKRLDETKTRSSLSQPPGWDGKRASGAPIGSSADGTRLLVGAWVQRVIEASIIDKLALW